MAFERANQQTTVGPVTELVVTDAEANVLLELVVAGRADEITVMAHSDDKGLLGRSSWRIERTERTAVEQLDDEPYRTPAPTEPGWYAYSGGRHTMIFHLSESGQWSAHSDNGTATDCDWGYIEQALGVFQILPLDTTPLAKIT